MKNIANRITAVLMIIYLSAVFLFVVFRHKTDIPKFVKLLPKSRSVDTLCEHSAQRFPKRNLIISLNSKLRSSLAERIANGVFIDDSMLLDIEEHDTLYIKETADRINKFKRSYKGSVYVIDVPSSSGVYENLLPEYLRKNTEVNSISDLYAALDNDIREIDAYNILKMLSENYIYYRSDSRWTSYGAYCVYRTAIQKLGFSPIPYDKYTIDHVDNDFRGDLYSKTLYSRSKPDIIDIYRYPSGAEIMSCLAYDSSKKSHLHELYDKSKLDSGDKYDVYLGDKYPLIRLITSVANKKKLLVITDSFGSCFIPFLTQHYNEIAIVSLEEADGLVTDYVNPNQYEQTLFLFGTNSLADRSIINILGSKKGK